MPRIHFHNGSSREQPGNKQLLEMLQNEETDGEVLQQEVPIAA